MTYTIKISDKVKSDLLEIYAYTFQNWGHYQAENYLSEIEKITENLLRFPFLGKFIDSQKMVYRLLEVKEHFLFYSVDRDDEQVMLLSILHASSDMQAHLNHLLQNPKK